MIRRGEKDINKEEVKKQVLIFFKQVYLITNRTQFFNAKKVLEHICQSETEIDFDGMMYRTVKEKLADLLAGEKQSWLLVDEAQDMNHIDIK